MAYCRHFPTFQVVSQPWDLNPVKMDFFLGLTYPLEALSVSMKKLYASLLFTVLFTACSTTPAVSEEAFNLDFKFGYGSNDNELNTFDDTYTKDMVMDDPITISLVLTDEELASIQAKIEELDVFTEPYVAPNGVSVMMSPCIHYSLEVQVSGSTQNDEWTCSNTSSNKAEFVNFMFDFIDSQEEVQALPEPQGGYM